MAYNYGPTSRYVLNDAGTEANRKTLKTGRYYLYTVKQGDNMERIAKRALGTTDRYWEIADMNPQVKHPHNLSVGDVIRVPL